jgi:hypothetical protein
MNGVTTEQADKRGSDAASNNLVLPHFFAFSPISTRAATGWTFDPRADELDVDA